MKKRFCCVLCAGLVISSMFISAAAQTQPETELLLTAAPSAETYSLAVNGETLDLGENSVYISGGKLMVPVRKVAEKLGFSVSWNNSEKSVHLDNKEVNTDLHIGTDSYYMASSTAIGMSAPTPLGAAPALVNGTTYAPVEMFNILYCADVVSAKDKEINITTKTADNTGVQIPNPFTEYKTISEALDALSFKAAVPSQIPDGYSPAYIATMGSDFLQISYKKNDSEIMFRTATGTDDISGDYNTYKNIENVKIDNLSVSFRVSDKTMSAIWTSNGFSYALYSNGGISKKEASAIIKSIK